jgi:4-hydroxybenzoate polyprenyltransferase
MREVAKLYRLFNVLSLDVAAGAVVGALFIAKIYDVIPSITSLISLGITVWIIYTIDRLLDVRDAKGEVASERHRFHKRNQKGLLQWLLFMMMMDFVLIFFIPTLIMKRGILLAVIVLIYILLRRQLYFLKELFVALLYTAGIAIPSMPENQVSVEASLPLLALFLIALLNLIIFSWYERENDRNEKQDSLATIVNEMAIRFILVCLFIIALSISGYLILYSAESFLPQVFFLMIAILFLIVWQKRFFDRNDYYRLLGDSIFLLPLIYIL